MPSAKPSPAPDEKAWWTGLKWTLSAHMQLERFDEAFFEQINAELDAEHRHRLNDDSENSRSWRESYDTNYEPYNPQRPLRVPSWALYMQVSSELDLLIVAVRNVLRAQDRLPDHVRTSMGDQDVLELLRNIAEHWDETGGRSERELAERYPTVKPDAVSYTNKEVWLGGVDSVSLSRIKAWLYRGEKALRDSLSRDGAEGPDDGMASQLPGDDDLPWPTERLRYHWSIPHLRRRRGRARRCPRKSLGCSRSGLFGSGSATPRTEPVPGWRARRSPCIERRRALNWPWSAAIPAMLTTRQ